MSLLYGLIQCVLFTLPPSPYEIARAEQTEKINESLTEKIEESLKKWRKTTCVTKEAKDIIKAVEEEKIKTRRSIKHMESEYLKKMIIILVIFSLSHLCGINIIVTFLVDIFSSTDISNIILVLVTGLSEFLFIFFQMTIADSFARLHFLPLLENKSLCFF